MSRTEELLQTLQREALGGSKTPHRVSNPVFRRRPDGKIVVAAFVWTFTPDELKADRVGRPAYWLTCDVTDGDRIESFSCRENDFCDLPPDAVCDLRPETDEVFSKEYRHQTLAVFDLALRKYQLTGVFDKALSDAYMYMMLRMVSVGFKEPYRQLNHV